MNDVIWEPGISLYRRQAIKEHIKTRLAVIPTIASKLLRIMKLRVEENTL
ncbi:MAG: hypothetical protein WC231_05250 [Dehalococcoidales bacterium]|jgi:hypothetical protein|nr:hypothetical protein [Dehalococcoidales bacterium]MDX9986054.1 hypothetical protein [Dehalococcoidales bacterium]NLE90150.1 hypothetical protein [Dehalococcoidales bacterium]